LKGIRKKGGLLPKRAKRITGLHECWRWGGVAGEGGLCVLRGGRLSGLVGFARKTKGGGRQRGAYPGGEKRGWVVAIRGPSRGILSQKKEGRREGAVVLWEEGSFLEARRKALKTRKREIVVLIEFDRRRGKRWRQVGWGGKGTEDSEKKKIAWRARKGGKGNEGPDFPRESLAAKGGKGVISPNRVGKGRNIEFWDEKKLSQVLGR